MTFSTKTSEWKLQVQMGVFDPGETILQDDVDPDDIQTIKVIRTVVGGKTLHSLE